MNSHINRLNMIERQRYGRAGFELLRARVLPWESAKILRTAARSVREIPYFAGTRLLTSSNQLRTTFI